MMDNLRKFTIYVITNGKFGKITPEQCFNVLSESNYGWVNIAENLVRLGIMLMDYGGKTSTLVVFY